MRFRLDNRRDVRGNRIEIEVVAERERVIAAVTTVLDDFELGTDTFSPEAVHFERVFRQAGEAGPGRGHTLVVTATDQAGTREVAVRKWEDDS